MPERRISVVVPSYDRAPYLDVLLRSLTWSAVAPADFEVIVVNDGGADDLPGIVDAWRCAGLEVRLVTLRTSGPPRNNARARNAGLAVARHAIVLQTDPDIVFVDDVLSAVRAAVDDRSICSCDGYYPLTREDTQALVFRAGAPPVTPESLRRAAAGRPNQVLSPDGVGGLHGAFACATQVLRDLGGYDESFEYWGWEDRELLVTAAARGLKRRHLPATLVTHLWHPPLRGALGREELAATRQVSQAGWDVQMQRVAAEYPRRHRPRPMPRQAQGPEPAAGAGLEPFSLAALARWRTGTDDEDFGRAVELLEGGAVADAQAALPRVFQLCFDALSGEADVLRAAGHLQLARDVWCYALRRPWEPGRSGGRALQLAPRDARTPSPLALYTHVDDTLEQLALCEDALDQPARCERVLDALADLEHGAVRVAAVRVRRGLRRGNLAAACAAASALPEATLGPEQTALQVECLLLEGRVASARARLLAWAASDGGDYFARLRRAAYLREVDVHGTALDCDPVAAAEVSEFLFSAGVRSERAGLDVAAGLLFRRFSDHGGAAEPRVRAECATRLTAARGRVARLAGTAVASRLLGSSPNSAAIDQAR
jgi:Glycosyl transferase family 2